MAGDSSIMIFSFKTSETLLGIETNILAPIEAIAGRYGWLQNLWNPFRDWNRHIHSIHLKDRGFKTSETLLGIETSQSMAITTPPQRFKTSETLLGIETKMWQTDLVLRHCFKTSETLLGIETQDSL